MTETTTIAREPGGPTTSGFVDDPNRERQEVRRDDVGRATGTDVEVFRGLAETAGAGLEGARIEEMLTPFIALLQSNSPQVDPTSAVYLAKAQQGMFINTASSRLYPSDGFPFVPCAREYQYGEWTPRDKGGGFHGTRGPDDPEVQALLKRYGRFQKLPTERGTEFVEQFNVYGFAADLVLVDGQPWFDPASVSRVVLPFTSTKIGVYKRWFASMGEIRYPYQGRSITPAMWAHVWMIRSVPQTNDKGKFWNYAPIGLVRGENPRDSLILPDDPLFAAGKEFSEMVRTGQARADYDTAVAAAGTTEPGDAYERDSRGRGDDAPPF